MIKSPSICERFSPTIKHTQQITTNIFNHWRACAENHLIRRQYTLCTPAKTQHILYAQYRAYDKHLYCSNLASFFRESLIRWFFRRISKWYESPPPIFYEYDTCTPNRCLIQFMWTSSVTDFLQCFYLYR